MDYVVLKINQTLIHPYSKTMHAGSEDHQEAKTNKETNQTNK